MTLEQKGRFWQIGKKLVGLLAIGVAYYLFITLTGWKIPCVFYLISGKYCPGCGVTRMCLALVRLDFSAAFHHNALVMVLLPFALCYGIYRWIAYARTGKTDFSKPEQIGLIVVALLVMAFWILRNTSRFSWLAP